MISGMDLRRFVPPVLGGFCFLWLAGIGVAAPSDAVDAARQAGKTAYQQGDFQIAIQQWTRAGRDYEKAGQTSQAVLTLSDLGAAYQFLGEPELAESALLRALELARRQQDPSLLIPVENNLGALYVQFQPSTAEAHLRNALALAEKAGATQPAALAWNNLGNLFASRELGSEATKAYTQSITLARQSRDETLLAQSSLNLARLALRAERPEDALPLLSESEKATLPAPDSYQKIQQLLSAGELNNALAAKLTEKRAALRAHAAELEKTALQTAERLRDNRSISLASGLLGTLAEQDGKIDEAFPLTRRARFLAQQEGAPYLLYRWEWQMGRLFKAQGNTEEAIGAYRRAIHTFGSVCDCATSPNAAGSAETFQDTIRPLYYGLADLLLQQAASTKDDANGKTVQPLLVEARDTVELLKSAELVDYFQDSCVSASLAKVKDVDNLLTDAAAVYFIPLPDRTEILVGLPGGLQRFTAPVTSGALTAKVRRFRLHLQRSGTQQYLPYAKELYDLLIRPIEPALQANKVKTLVFVPDGALRTIPLAALYDGHKYVIEEYSLAVTPGLTLMDPRPLPHGAAKVLIAGLSQSVQGYEALDSVPEEVTSIEGQFQASTLLNKDFVKPELQTSINDGNYAIIHIASHGEFSGKSDRSYLLTYDGKLSLDDLEHLIRPHQFRGVPVEMLFLSACQTAAGDDRAALGLAGIAIKSGARSALASLWSVSDEATAKLVEEFYAELKKNPTESKSEALQKAQIALLKDEHFAHPMFWSPFQVIGNWF